MKLKATLLVYMLPLLVLPVAALGYLAYHFSTTLQQQLLYQHVSKQLQLQQQQLNEFLNFHQTRLSVLSASRTLSEFLTGQSAEQQVAAQSIFEKFLSQDHNIRAIRLLKLNGDEQISVPAMQSSPPRPDRFRNEYFSVLQGMIDDYSIFVAHDGDNSGLQLFFARKIYTNEQNANRQLWGYLLLVTEPTPFIAAVNTPITPNSVNLIINRTATIAYAANQALIGSAFTPSHYRIIQQSLEQDRLVSTLLLGQPKLLAGRNLSAGYQLVYGLDEAELTAMQANRPVLIILLHWPF